MVYRKLTDGNVQAADVIKAANIDTSVARPDVADEQHPPPLLARPESTTTTQAPPSNVDLTVVTMTTFITVYT